MKKFYVCCCLFLLLTAAPAYASTFTDNFDNEGVTNNSWDVYFGSWSHVAVGGSDLGYHGTNTGDLAAVSIANKQMSYSQSNLSVDTLIRLVGDVSEKKDVSAGLVFVSDSFSSTPGEYNEYTVLLEADYEPHLDSYSYLLNVWNNQITPTETNENLLASQIVNFDFNTFYGLYVAGDSLGDISVALYDPSTMGVLGSFTNLSLIYSFDSGPIIIAATDEATFNDFSISGNPVPIPGAVWLLGSGLAGLIAVRRRK